MTSDQTRATQRKSTMGFMRSFKHGDWTALVEDDGRIAADVWLYNRVPPPQQPPWQQPRGEMPFLNSAHHVNDNDAVRSPSPDAVSVSWTDPTEPDLQITVSIDNQPIAWLAPGAKPGWSALAKRDGPLAKTKTA